jgi:hypothetical protein
MMYQFANNSPPVSTKFETCGVNWMPTVIRHSNEQMMRAMQGYCYCEAFAHFNKYIAYSQYKQIAPEWFLKLVHPISSPRVKIQDAVRTPPNETTTNFTSQQKTAVPSPTVRRKKSSRKVSSLKRKSNINFQVLKNHEYEILSHPRRYV